MSTHSLVVTTSDWDGLSFRYLGREFAFNPNLPNYSLTHRTVVLDSDMPVNQVLVVEGFLPIHRFTAIASDPINDILLHYSTSSGSFSDDLDVRHRVGFDVFLEYDSTSSVSSGIATDLYRLKFIRRRADDILPYYSGDVYLSPATVSASFFSLFLRPAIRIAVAPRPRVVLPGDELYRSRVSVYSVETSQVREIGQVPVREREIAVSGRSLIGDTREAVIGISFGNGSLNDSLMHHFSVSRVYISTPFGNVPFFEQDIPSSQRVTVDFHRHLYDFNGGSPVSWLNAPKRNGYSYVGYPRPMNGRTPQGLLLYWRDYSVFPVDFSGSVSCEVVVDSVVGQVRRPIMIQVYGRRVRYRYSDFVSLGSIEFVAGLGSEMYSPSEIVRFMDSLFVIDGSVVEEYGYDSFVGAGERVIFPNVLRMQVRSDDDDAFEKFVNIVGGVRFFDSDGRLIFSGELETSAGERRVSYNSMTEVMSVEFQNGIVSVLKEKLLNAEGEFDREQLLKFFSIKPYDMLGSGYDFVSLFSRDSNGNFRYRTGYSAENPPAFFTLRFWLRHFITIMGLDVSGVPDTLVIPNLKLKVLVFNCLYTGIGANGRKLSDQWYEEEVIDEVDLMRFVVSAQKVMGATDGDSLSSTIGEAFGRLLSLFDLRLFIGGDMRVRVVSSFIPSGGVVEDIEMLEGYQEKVLQGREKDFVYLFPLFRPVQNDDYANNGFLPPPASNWVLDYKGVVFFTTPNMYFHRDWSVYGEARYSSRVQPRFGVYFSASRIREGSYRVQSSFLHLPKSYNGSLMWRSSSQASPSTSLVVYYGIFLGRTLGVDYSVSPPAYNNRFPNLHSFASSLFEAFYGVPALLDVAESHHYTSRVFSRLTRHALFYLRRLVDQDGISIEKPAVMVPSPGGSLIQTFQPRPSVFKVVPSVRKFLGYSDGCDYEGMEDYMGVVYEVKYGNGQWQLFHEFEAKRIWEQVRRHVVGVEGECAGIYERLGDSVRWRGKVYQFVRLEPRRHEGNTRVVMKRIY